MAGRKQHYIPQHLLRGFQASRSGKNVQVIVYRQGKAPFPSATEGVAAERDFYSPPSTDGTDTLDDLITKFETEHFNPILDTLRNVKNGEVERLQAATAVVHLTLRAAHLRGAFAGFVREFLAQFRVVLQDTEATRAFAGVDSPLPDSHLAQEIAQELDALPLASLPPKDRTLIEKLTRFRVREKFDESLHALLPLLQKRLIGMEQALPAAIDRGHLNALERSLVSEARVATLMNLRWQVISLLGAQHFVLPDCVAVAGIDGAATDLQPYTMAADAEVVLLAMPISSTQVLIGSRDRFEADPLLLNAEFARCSLEFIVSSKQDQFADGLSKEIGKKLLLSPRPKPRKDWRARRFATINHSRVMAPKIFRCTSNFPVACFAKRILKWRSGDCLRSNAERPRLSTWTQSLLPQMCQAPFPSCEAGHSHQRSPRK